MTTLILDDPEHWEAEVLKTVRKILTLCWREEPERVDQFLDPQFHPTWFKVFIHETIDYSENYENLEYIGDAVLKNVFPVMMMKTYGLNKAEMTNINSFYMSRNDQGQGHLAKILGLTKHIQVAAPDDFDISKLAVDVFESFFGALSQIGDEIQLGVGYIACYNLITILFSNKDIEEAKYGDPTTQVTQRLIKTGIIGDGVFPENGRKKGGIVERDLEKNLRQIEVTISLTRDQVNHAKKVYGINLPLQLATAIGPAKNVARYQAYQDALKTLDRSGLTREQAETWKREKMFSPLDSRLVRRMEEKARAKGYDELRFVNPSKTDSADAYILMLVGREIDPPHRLQSLFSKFVSKANVKGVVEDKNQIKEQLIREYLASREC